MASMRKKNFYVHCSNCTVEDSNCKSSHATIVREDDGTTISIRLGKRQRVCSICLDNFVDSGRSFCFQCNKVVTLKMMILCKECRRPAVELPGVSSHEDFEEVDCPLCIAEDCEESGLVVWLPNCNQEDHVCCLECFIHCVSERIRTNELHWCPEASRFSVLCFGTIGMKACPARVESAGLLNLVSRERFRKYEEFAMEKLTTKLLGMLCPHPRCGGYIMDLPPAIVSKMVVCPYCNDSFCQVCKTLPPRKGPKDMCMKCDLQRMGKDKATLDLINSSSKACPWCGLPTTHYRGHACHHIAPGGGCRQCHNHWCYKCGAKSRNKGGWAASCQCFNTGHTYCDFEGTCGCPICPDCRPGKKCPHCSDRNLCPSCNPSHPEHEKAKRLWSEYQFTSAKEEKVLAERRLMDELDSEDEAPNLFPGDGSSTSVDNDPLFDPNEAVEPDQEIHPNAIQYWACEVCTFHNDVLPGTVAATVCSMCNSPIPEMVVLHVRPRPPAAAVPPPPPLPPLPPPPPAIAMPPPPPPAAAAVPQLELRPPPSPASSTSSWSTVSSSSAVSSARAVVSSMMSSPSSLSIVSTQSLPPPPPPTPPSTRSASSAIPPPPPMPSLRQQLSDHGRYLLTRFRSSSSELLEQAQLTPSSRLSRSSRQLSAHSRAMMQRVSAATIPTSSSPLRPDLLRRMSERSSAQSEAAAAIPAPPRPSRLSRLLSPQTRSMLQRSVSSGFEEPIANQATATSPLRPDLLRRMSFDGSFFRSPMLPSSLLRHPPPQTRSMLQRSSAQSEAAAAIPAPPPPQTALNLSRQLSDRARVLLQRSLSSENDEPSPNHVARTSNRRVNRRQPSVRASSTSRARGSSRFVTEMSSLLQERRRSTQRRRQRHRRSKRR